MPLTDVKIRTAKPGPKVVKLSDGGGLQLWITPDGAKRWRLAYRNAGKQKTLAIGVYPAIGLKEAREAREAAKELLSQGRDPSKAKQAYNSAKAAVIANTFDTIAEEFISKKRREGRAETTLTKIEWLISLAKPTIGSRPVSEISASEVLNTLKTVEARGRLETARRLLATLGEVFRYAVATARAENDPTGALKGALTAPKVTHRAAIIEPLAFGSLLRAIEGYEAMPETKVALELLALTFVRSGELRAAEWSEFDLEKAVWEIPAEKMKMRRPHRVPLASRAIKILLDLKAITGNGKYVFPCVRSSERHMSGNTLNAALRRLGFTSDEMTAHGFRAAASSMLNECGLWNADAIERQLAHVDNDNVRRAYHRADYWDERVRMMNYWSERCDSMKCGGDVIALKKQAL